MNALVEKIIAGEPISQLIEEGFPVNGFGDDDLCRTPLVAAAMIGSTDVQDELLEAGALYTEIDGWKFRPPLGWAAYYGSNVSLLIAEGTPINQRDGEGRSPLMLAAMGNHHAIVKELLEAKASPLGADDIGFTALDHAATRNAVKSAALLWDAMGLTPRHPAAVRAMEVAEEGYNWKGDVISFFVRKGMPEPEFTE